MNFQDFANDIVVDVIKTAFYGENTIPIMGTYFPDSIVDTAVIDQDLTDSRGSFDSVQSWEFGIDVLLVGEKYRRYADSLELPSSITVSFAVESDLTISYQHSSGSYDEPPEENIDVNSVENTFNPEITVDDEAIELTGNAKEVFEEFSKKYKDELDEDIEYDVNKNWKTQFLWSLITPQKR
jgi:hypothetical protein